VESLLAVVIVLAAAAAAAATALVVVRRRAPLERGSAVIVCTRRPDDQSIHGVVGDVTRRFIVLSAARYLEPTGDSTPIGVVVIPRENVAFVQTGVAPVDVGPDVKQRPTAGPLPDLSRPAILREAPPTPEDAARTVLRGVDSVERR
jgi:hypothetical protein